MEIIDNRIYIFGAHSRAQTFGAYVNRLYPDVEIVAYLYDNDEDNPSQIGGVPVFLCDGGWAFDNSLPVFLATRGEFHKVIGEHLRQLRVQKIVPVTPEIDMDLRNRFVRSEFKNKSREFCKINELGGLSSCSIYVVRSVFDKQTQSDVKLNPYEKYIQAGTALTDERLGECVCFDNKGDNISHRNRQFCELTGLYWIWKNAKEDIIGIEHYRRRFILPENWIDIFEAHKVDVILPVPLFVAPNLKENYIARHTGLAWNVLMDVLKNCDLEKYAYAKDFFETTGLYSPCNMMIMRRDILREYCAWLFPILFQVEERVDEMSDPYQNRYPGFLAERLLTFWCYYYENKYKIVYADKNFLN